MKLNGILTSTWCNNWPTAKIILNDNILYEGLIEKTFDFEFNVPTYSKNRLEIFMINKQFGPQWNTKVVNNLIVEDQTLFIEKFEFDEVDIKPILTRQTMNLLSNGNNIHENYSDHACKFNFNSFLILDFTNPIYNWIIFEKYIRNNDEIIINENSFGSWNNKFNYSFTKEYIKKIKELL